MSRSEKYCLIELLKTIEPDVSIEIGTYKGGSLQVLSQFSKQVYSLDISPEPKKNLKSKLANRILNPKRSGWYFYKLRTMCNQLPHVDHSGMIGKKYVNDNFASHLSQYQGAIAATTFYPTIKYWETSASGCLTFMEITEQNDGAYLGYKDGETAIFINEKNYKDKFEAFLNDPDNPKWEQIANAGRQHAIDNLTNDNATEKLVEVMKKLL
jgi:hypothetical protein